MLGSNQNVLNSSKHLLSGQLMHVIDIFMMEVADKIAVCHQNLQSPTFNILQEVRPHSIKLSNRFSIHLKLFIHLFSLIIKNMVPSFKISVSFGNILYMSHHAHTLGIPHCCNRIQSFRPLWYISHFLLDTE